MIHKRIKLIAVFVLVAQLSYAAISLPKLISDGMVLQRNTKIKVWGWAAPNEKVKLTLHQNSYHTVADPNGNWTINLPEQHQGGPYQMVLTGSNQIVLNNILFGDVWVCSGQSNMELGMDRLVDQYPEVIKNANNPNIRQFLVPDEYDFNKRRTDFSAGKWQEVNTKNILNFSAVAYFFANDIYQKYKVPIGLINAALGGSPAESWMSEDAIKKFPNADLELQKFKDGALIKEIEQSDRARSNEWYGLLNQKDEGLKNNWKSSGLDDQDWQEMNIPGYWADGKLGSVNGVVWFRKEIHVSKEQIGKPAKLLLGRIIDADSVFINDNFVGTTSYQYPPRRYLLSNTILKEGKNTIVVRVVSNGGRGGFVLDKPYELVVGDTKIDLKGKWKYRLGATMGPTPSQTFVRWKPVGLFNAMIAPLLNYSIKGALWYQGEANTGRSKEYGQVMTTLINDWRNKWGQGDFPFLYVQLPGFMDEKSEPTESAWAELRQQQLQLLTVPKTAMAVAIDLGEWNDIHPLNKKDVGVRLALLAKSMVHGDKATVSSGPLFKSIVKKGNQLEMDFTHVGGGLIAKNDQTLKYFAVAGVDRKFVWAKAIIKQGKVVVWNDGVSDPIYVRYAWADNPATANLYNKEGLPASPFEAKVKP